MPEVARLPGARRRRVMITRLIAAFLAAAGLGYLGAAPPPTAHVAPAVPKVAVASPAATTTPLPSRTPPRHIPPASWTVLPLGDSITLGVGSTTGDGYRGPLLQLAPGITYVGNQGAAPLLHMGLSGWRIDQLLAVAPTALAMYRPAYVLLHAGTNDTVQGHTSGTMLADMTTLLDAIHAADPGGMVLLAVIPITPWATSAQQAQEGAFDDGLPALVAARARWVVLIDTRDTEIGRDRVHLTDAGYARLAYLWAAALPDVRTS